nr:DUF4326 domain-containing protein [Mycobacteroides chelonae]
MPERIQLRRTRGWRKPEGAIVVSRPSRWGNPFRIYHGHSLIWPQMGASPRHLGPYQRERLHLRLCHHQRPHGHTGSG